MKILFYIFFITILLNSCENDFLFIELVSKTRTGGAPGAGTNINYYLKYIPPKKQKNITVESIWIGKRYLKPKFVTNSGDTVKITASYYIPGEHDISEGKIPKKEKQVAPPYEYEGKALIGYKTSKGLEYKVIKEIRIIPVVPAP